MSGLTSLTPVRLVDLHPGPVTPESAYGCGSVRFASGLPGEKGDKGDKGDGVAINVPPQVVPIVANVGQYDEPVVSWTGPNVFAMYWPVTVTVRRQITLTFPPSSNPPYLELYILTGDWSSKSVARLATGDLPSSVMIPPGDYIILLVDWVPNTGHTVDIACLPELKRALEAGGPTYLLELDSTGSVLTPVLSGGSIELSHVEGMNTSATRVGAHAEGMDTQATGYYAHAEGRLSKASETNSHAEGYATEASGESSHAEGVNAKASGHYSHAEGFGTISSNFYAHAEGYQSVATNQVAHAEGNATTASGRYSHSEGNSTTASGEASHAEGASTAASGAQSHAGGLSAVASRTAEFAQGVTGTQHSIVPLAKKSGASTTFNLPLTSTAMSFVDAVVTAYTASYAVVAVWKVQALVVCSSASARRLVGTPTITKVFSDAGASAWTVAVTVPAANRIDFTCATGSGSATWSVDAQLTEGK